MSFKLLVLCLLAARLPAAEFSIPDYKIERFHEFELRLDVNGMSGAGGSSYLTPGFGSWEGYGDDLSLGMGPTIHFYLFDPAWHIDVFLPLTYSDTKGRKHQDSSYISGVGFSGSKTLEESDEWNMSARPEAILTHFRDGWQYGLKGNWVHSSYGRNMRREDSPGASNQSLQVSEGRNLTSGFSAEARWGLGRLVQGEPAWDALKLLEELERLGFLKRPLEPEEVQALAAQAAFNRQSFTWDLRDDRRRDALALYELLKGKELLAKEGPEAVLACDDVRDYLYAGRANGAQLLLFLNYQGIDNNGYSRNEYSSGSVSWTTGAPAQVYSAWERGLGPGIEAGYSRSLGLDWQLDLTQRLSYVPDAPGSLKHEQERALSESRLWLTYIPSTRFLIGLEQGLNLSTAKVRNMDDIRAGNRYGWASRYGRTTLAAPGFIYCVYKLAPYVDLSVVYSALWDREQHWDQKGGIPSSASQADIDELDRRHQGAPSSEVWNRDLRASVTWRAL